MKVRIVPPCEITSVEASGALLAREALEAAEAALP